MKTSTSNRRGEELAAVGLDLAVPLEDDELADLLERGSRVDLRHAPRTSRMSREECPIDV